MNQTVTVVDYGIGNLKSVCRACEEAGAIVNLTGNTDLVSRADRLILPGVGAFPRCINTLRNLGLDVAIKSFMNTERPFLGICVGAQLMLDSSDEFGRHKGFGFIPGTVEAIPRPKANVSYKIPHVGWSALKAPSHTDWDDTVLRGASPSEPFYFTHSFAMQTKQPTATVASCSYFGYQFSAVVNNGVHYGCQFHPEKSGRAGLMFLENFFSSKGNNF